MASTGAKVVLGIGCGFLAVIGACLATCVGCATMLRHSGPPSSANEPQPVTNPITYTVLKQWSIPAGGRGRVVIIDSSNNNETDLRKLGEQFRSETPRSDFEFDQVYDSAKAASMSDAADKERLSKKQLAFYHRHKVMFYSRNPTTHFEELSIFPAGLDGHMTQIKF